MLKPHIYQPNSIQAQLYSKQAKVKRRKSIQMPPTYNKEAQLDAQFNILNNDRDDLKNEYKQLCEQAAKIDEAIKDYYGVLEQRLKYLNELRDSTQEEIISVQNEVINSLAPDISNILSNLPANYDMQPLMISKLIVPMDIRIDDILSDDSPLVEGLSPLKSSTGYIQVMNILRKGWIIQLNTNNDNDENENEPIVLMPTLVETRSCSDPNVSGGDNRLRELLDINDKA